MTNPKHTDTSRSGDLVKRRYLLVKRGLYYAPDNCGYTGIKDRAGRYFASDAGGETVAIHEDEAPAFSSACWEDVKVRHLSDRIEALEAENERLREALATLRHWSFGHIDALLLYAGSSHPNDSHVKSAVEFCRILAPKRRLRMDALEGSGFHPARTALERIGHD